MSGPAQASADGHQARQPISMRSLKTVPPQFRQRRFISCWARVGGEVTYVVDPGPPSTADRLVAELEARGLDRLDFIRSGSDSGLQAAVRQYGNLNNNPIWIWGHGGEAKYHGLQTQLVTRFGRGSQFQASYTWSKSTGNLGLADSERIHVSLKGME